MSRTRLSLAASLALAVLVSIRTGSAAAQDTATGLADALIACMAIEQAEQRLACYDALAGPLAGLKPDQENDEDALLFKFAGKDDGDSQPFQVADRWRVVWHSDTSVLTIELWDPQGSLIGTIGFQIGKGGGRSDVQPPGHYKLAVRGSGSWRISVIRAE